MRFRETAISTQDEGVSRASFRALGVCLALSVHALPVVDRVQAQGRPPEERSLAASLLAVSVPGPVAPFRPSPDTITPGQAVRFELDFAGDLATGAPTGEVNTIVLGVRSESQATGEHGLLRRGAGLVGARAGFRVGEHDANQPLSAWEIYFGGRNLITRHGLSFMDAGLELAIGWGNLGYEKRASLGFRAPIELVHEGSRARATLFVVPTMAWGRLRTRACEDLGPGDDCGDLGFQVATGRSLFLLAGGAGITIVPARLSVNVGIQRLFALGEESRLWIGTAWTH